MFNLSGLLALHDYATLGNKEVVFTFFIWKQTGITCHMAQSHIKKERNLTTTKLHILKKIITYQENMIAS